MFDFLKHRLPSQDRLNLAKFAMNRYLNNFVHIKPSHTLDLFDKLIALILNYGSEVWGFAKANNIESVYLQFFCQTVNSE